MPGRAAVDLQEVLYYCESCFRVALVKYAGVESAEVRASMQRHLAAELDFALVFVGAATSMMAACEVPNFLRLLAYHFYGQPQPQGPLVLSDALILALEEAIPLKHPAAAAPEYACDWWKEHEDNELREPLSHDTLEECLVLHRFHQQKAPPLRVPRTLGTLEALQQCRTRVQGFETIFEAHGYQSARRAAAFHTIFEATVQKADAAGPAGPADADIDMSPLELFDIFDPKATEGPLGSDFGVGLPSGEDMGENSDEESREGSDSPARYDPLGNDVYQPRELLPHEFPDHFRGPPFEGAEIEYRSYYQQPRERDFHIEYNVPVYTGSADTEGQTAPGSESEDEPAESPGPNEEDAAVPDIEFSDEEDPAESPTRQPSITFSDDEDPEAPEPNVIVEHPAEPDIEFSDEEDPAESPAREPDIITFSDDDSPAEVLSLSDDSDPPLAPNGTISAAQCWVCPRTTIRGVLDNDPRRSADPPLATPLPPTPTHIQCSLCPRTTIRGGPHIPASHPTAPHPNAYTVGVPTDNDLRRSAHPPLATPLPPTPTHIQCWTTIRGGPQIPATLPPPPLTALYRPAAAPAGPLVQCHTGVVRARHARRAKADTGAILHHNDKKNTTKPRSTAERKKAQSEKHGSQDISKKRKLAPKRRQTQTRDARGRFQTFREPTPAVSPTPPTTNTSRSSSPDSYEFRSRSPTAPTSPAPVTATPTTDDEMTAIIEPFWGDRPDENAQDFFRAFNRAMGDKDDDVKRRLFVNYLRADSEADEWYAALDPNIRAGWAEIERAFHLRWPRSTIARKTAMEYEEEVLAMKLKEETLGLKETVAGREVYSHIAWADRIGALVSRAGLATGTMYIGLVRRALPTLIRERITATPTDWSTFLANIRSIDIDYIRDGAAELGKERERVRRFEERVRSLEAQASPTRAIRTQMAQTNISTSLPRSKQPSTDGNPFMNAGGGQGNLSYGAPTQGGAGRGTGGARLPRAPPTEADRQAWATRHGPETRVTESTPYPLRPGTLPVNSNECFGCGQSGHIAPRCPVPQERKLNVREADWRAICRNILRIPFATPMRYVTIDNYGGVAAIETVEQAEEAEGEQGNGAGPSE
ncbi:hypothetical protein D9615_004471 [Tricholomella constricta]|uniref:CCHC-type domain-containing protein n=1 Tax=Tricholomella constricta TaxID=117010 RepID=A0A8H5HFP3_9AGAR|nr:hypothetical protein D9615_004471 [Tricholomella constricta]